MPEHKPVRKILAAVPLVLAVALSVVFYFYFTPETAVSVIGLENAYLLMFVVALLGGLTTFNTVPYYSVLLMLAVAGLNPLLLGLFSACGVMCGDSISYLVGRQGAVIVPRRLHALFGRIRVVATNHPRIFPLVCFLYGSLSPLSNDFITVPAGLARIPYLKTMVPLALGNIVFNVTLAYLAVYAYEFVRLLVA